MAVAPADGKDEEIAWEQAVSVRRASSPRSQAEERTAADEVMRYFAAQSVGEGERRAWAAALRKPVETALEDLRHHPRRAATLLAPVIESAVRTARHHHRERQLEVLSKWCLCLTRPKFWPWAMKALWNGDPVWTHIQEKAQWHEVPEIILVDNRTGLIVGRAQTHAHLLLHGEVSLLDFCNNRRQLGQTEGNETRVPDQEGAQGDLPSRVVVLASWRCKLVARVRGLPPLHLRSSLQALCEEAEALLDRPAPAGANHVDMLDGLLAEGLVSQVASSRPRTWVIAAAAMALACVLAWAGVQEYRWHMLVTALDNEPGLKVLRQDSTWGRHVIDGLRDPLARKPEELALALGISPQDVTLRFKAFICAEEPFATQRATADSPAPHRIQATSLAPQ